LRLLEAADADDYKLLRDAVLAAHEEAFTSDAATESRRSAQSYLTRLSSDGGSFTLGAFIEGALAGAVTCERDARIKPHHVGHLTGMMVGAAWQGLGIGRALLHAAIEHARADAGLRQLTLSVTFGNGAASHLYERAGFSRYGTLPDALYVAGRYHDKLLMRLDLR
jgi:RimJ/RimL family protein N-acetyltransferase